jgi:UDPglucose--hexose-1-phosphate uridylyltransferase
VHSPRHARSVGELSGEELALVARAWALRSGAALEAGYPYVQALVNEGQAAGASRAHSHSQLVWLREPPPAVLDEAARGECPVCAHVAAELADGRRVVIERDGLVVLAAYAGRLPYELLVATESHPRTSAFASPRLPAALALLGDAIGRLRALEGPLPLNAWLHDGGHWHVEVMPRLSILAGLELGAGIYVNWLPPEEAAERLRRAA